MHLLDFVALYAFSQVQATSQAQPVPALADLYLNTLVGTLTGEALRTESIHFFAQEDGQDVQSYDETAELRASGSAGCLHCLTMVGSDRLRDVWEILDGVRRDNVSGDFLQAGVWHGGVSMFARAYFHVHGMDRKVFACDSFEGFPDDTSEAIVRKDMFKVSADVVAQNFAAFSLLDENVIFIRGFFNESLPNLHDRMLVNGQRISLLHLDADLYSSYLDILFNLYDLLEIGSYVVCDDCGFIGEAGRAVTDFRLLHAIDAPQELGRSKLTRYWQKTAEVQIDWRAYKCWAHSRLPWGLITRCQGFQADELWQKLALWAMESDESADFEPLMMHIAPDQDLASNPAFVDLLSMAVPVILQEMHRPGALQDRVKEALLLAHDCAEMAVELLHKSGDKGDKAMKARHWLNSVNEARFRVSILPSWALPLLV